MDDMAELLQLEKMVDVHSICLAYAVHVVTGEVNQHDMLCPVLLRREKLRP